MMKCFFFIAAVFCSTLLSAQTKCIAHRSHSGSNSNFSNDGADNFGLPRAETIKAMAKKKREQDSIRLRMDTMIKVAADTISKVTVMSPQKKKAVKVKRASHKL